MVCGRGAPGSLQRSMSKKAGAGDPPLHELPPGIAARSGQVPGSVENDEAGHAQVGGEPRRRDGRSRERGPVLPGGAVHGSIVIGTGHTCQPCGSVRGRAAAPSVHTVEPGIGSRQRLEYEDEDAFNRAGLLAADPAPRRPRCDAGIIRGLLLSVLLGGCGSREYRAGRPGRGRRGVRRGRVRRGGRASAAARGCEGELLPGRATWSVEGGVVTLEFGAGAAGPGGMRRLEPTWCGPGRRLASRRGWATRWGGSPWRGTGCGWSSQRTPTSPPGCLRICGSPAPVAGGGWRRPRRDRCRGGGDGYPTRGLHRVCAVAGASRAAGGMGPALPGGLPRAVRAPSAPRCWPGRLPATGLGGAHPAHAGLRPGVGRRSPGGAKGVRTAPVGRAGRSPAGRPGRPSAYPEGDRAARRWRSDSCRRECAVVPRRLYWPS